jgi:hypothetical protein
LALSGHRLVRCTCLLLTQSGHTPIQIVGLSSYDAGPKTGTCNEAARVYHLSG